MAHIVDGKLTSAISRLYRLLPRARRRQLFPVLALMLLSAMTELMTIGAILPFLTIVTNPAGALADHAQPFLRTVFGWYGGDLLLPAMIAFAMAALVAAAIRLVLIHQSYKFTSRLAHDLNVEVYRRTLHQPYRYHFMHNTSEIISSIGKVEIVIYTVLSPLLQVVTAGVISFSVVILLVAIDAETALTAAFGFGLLYLAVTYLTRRRLRENGRIAAAALSQRVQTVQDGLGAIRDVLIDRSQQVYVDKLKGVDWAFQKAEAANYVIGTGPRFVIEALGITFIAALTVLLSGRAGGLAAALPVLGALALSSQRVLPMFQTMYHGWVQISGNLQMLLEVLALLERPVSSQSLVGGDKARLQDWRSVTVESVGFRYSESAPWILKDVALTIERGARIGFFGKTGSGKSTLMDLLMGLIEPDEGTIRIDGKSLDAESIPHWQAQIAHVPQSIYLADDTIMANIAFGVPREQIDVDRVRDAAARANVAAFIEGLPETYESSVGERGVRLSGGQRQRIGIARALYKRASILVFDEATSALDTETEAAIVQAIQSLGRSLTILIVAHRRSTIAICDKVMHLNQGRVEFEEEISEPDGLGRESLGHPRSPRRGIVRAAPDRAPDEPVVGIAAGMLQKKGLQHVQDQSAIGRRPRHHLR